MEEKKNSGAFDDRTADIFDLKDGEVEKASKEEGFEEQGKVELPENVPYVVLLNEQLTQRMRPFLEKKTSSRDIISRSMLMRTSEGFVDLMASDGVSFLWTRVPAKANKFSHEIVFDIESMSAVSKTTTKKTVLMEKTGRLYAEFFGGEIFIPTYRIDPKQYFKEMKAPKTRVLINAQQLMEILNSMTHILYASDIPDLGFLFLGPDGAYVTNGVVVSKFLGNFPQTTLRQIDLSIIQSLISETVQEELFLLEFDDCWKLEAQTFSYVFPKITSNLADAYKAAAEAPRDVFYISFPYINTIFSVLMHMPDSSGVIDLDFQEGELRGEVKTKKGEASVFRLSESKQGAPSLGKTSVVMKSLWVALRVFKDDDIIGLGKMDGKLVLGTEKKVCAVLLRGQTSAKKSK